MYYEKYLILRKTLPEYISTLTSHGAIPPTSTPDSSTATSDGDKATMFYTFFCSVYTHSPSNLPLPEELPVPSSTITGIGISESDVYNALFSTPQNLWALMGFVLNF